MTPFSGRGSVLVRLGEILRKSSARPKPFLKSVLRAAATKHATNKAANRRFDRVDRQPQLSETEKCDRHYSGASQTEPSCPSPEQIRSFTSQPFERQERTMKRRVNDDLP